MNAMVPVGWIDRLGEPGGLLRQDLAIIEAIVVGRVVKLNRRNSFDVVNANGGGIYTIKSTDPTRQAAIALLRVGDSITVSVSPLIATSVAKCGLFGKGLFGC